MSYMPFDPMTLMMMTVLFLAGAFLCCWRYTRTAMVISATDSWRYAITTYVTPVAGSLIGFFTRGISMGISMRLGCVFANPAYRMVVPAFFRQGEGA